MADLEKLKRKPKTKDDEIGRLYKESLKGKPLYSSNEEAIKGITTQLETLAQKAGLSVDELLTRAETSREFREDDLDALMLARQIAYFKK